MKISTVMVVSAPAEPEGWECIMMRTACVHHSSGQRSVVNRVSAKLHGMKLLIISQKKSRSFLLNMALNVLLFSLTDREENTSQPFCGHLAHLISQHHHMHNAADPVKWHSRQHSAKRSKVLNEPIYAIQNALS